MLIFEKVILAIQILHTPSYQEVSLPTPIYLVQIFQKRLTMILTSIKIYLKKLNLVVLKRLGFLIALRLN